MPVAVADAQLQPFRIYTFAGCWDGVACHTAQVAVGQTTGPFYSGPAMGFEIVSTYEAGAGPADGLAYRVGAAQGFTFHSAIFDTDVYIANGCYYGSQFALERRTCVDPSGGYTFVAAMASPDFVPGSFNIVMRRGTPGALYSASDEVRSVPLSLVGVTQVVPEPTTVALLGGGLAVLAAAGWRRRRAC